MGKGEPIAKKLYSIFLMVIRLTFLCVAIAGGILIADVMGLIAYGYIIGKAMVSSPILSNLLFIEAVITMLIGVVAFVRLIEALYYRPTYLGSPDVLSKLRKSFERDRKERSPFAVIMIIVGLILLLISYIIAGT